MESAAIIGAVTLVTKRWAKQRKAEERDASRIARRWRSVSTRVTLKEAAFAEMQRAYNEVSGGTLPAHARQIMYAARNAIQERTGESLDDKYFTQHLLPEYMLSHPEITKPWNVVFDARGHFHEPHTGIEVPLGTLEVRQYLGDVAITASATATAHTSILYPTHGPRNRFNAALLIEKEGFLPLFRQVELAERYDLAIMSTKGLSTTASRMLVDRLCWQHQIPLLVLHDFDRAGFSIVGTLKRDTRRYQFRHTIKVVDVGLRLTDVKENGLESERVFLRRSISRSNLRENGATEEEIDFLFSNQRVELNAFTSAGLIAWIEGKLAELGIKKVIPDADTLESAFRRAAANQYIEARQQEIIAGAQRHADQARLPKALAKRVASALKDNPALPWDLAVAQIASAAKGSSRIES